MNPETGEVACLAVDERLCSANWQVERAGRAFGLLQEPFEAVANIPGGESAPVVEANILAQVEAISFPALLNLELGREPGNDPGASNVAGQRLEYVWQCLSLFHA